MIIRIMFLLISCFSNISLCLSVHSIGAVGLLDTIEEWSNYIKNIGPNERNAHIKDLNQTLSMIKIEPLRGANTLTDNIMLEMMYDLTQKNKYLIKDEEDKVQGFILFSFSEHTLHIHDLAIAPWNLQEGMSTYALEILKYLIEFLVSIAVNENVPEIITFLYDSDKVFYKNIGFIEEDEDDNEFKLDLSYLM